jgi:hypothetical protein
MLQNEPWLTPPVGQMKVSFKEVPDKVKLDIIYVRYISNIDDSLR